MPVEIIGKHAELSPGQYLKETIERGEKQGKVLTAVVPYFDEICIVWAPGKPRETRSRTA